MGPSAASSCPHLPSATFNEPIERLQRREASIYLRAQELEATEVDLRLDLVPAPSRQLPEVVCRLEQDIDVALVAAMRHHLGLLEEVARLPLVVTQQVDLSR